MAELTTEQKRALAIAAARKRQMTHETGRPGQRASEDVVKKREARLALEAAGLPPETLDEIGPGTALARSGANAATLGFANEIAAGVGALTGLQGERGDYAGNLAKEQALDQAARELYPGLSIAGGGAGAIGLGAGMVRRGIAAFPNAKTGIGMAGAGAVDGGVIGALAGAGNAPEGERLDGAAEGFGWGAGAGALGPAALWAASPVGRAIARRMQSTIGPAGNQAGARMERALSQNRMSAADLEAEMARLGPEGAVVDAMGAPGRSLARSAANRSPEAREALTTFSEQRMAQQPDRVTEALMRAGGLDAPVSPQALQDEIRQATRPAIDRAYDQARSLGFDINIEAFPMLRDSELGRQALEQGYRRAVEGMRRRGEQGDPSNLTILDEAKRMIDDAAEAAARAGRNNEAATARELSRMLRSQIDDSLPEYGGARALAQDAFARQEAVEAGAALAAPRVPAETLRTGRETAQERADDVARGYAAQKADAIANRRATTGALDASFGSPRQREAAEAALGPRVSTLDEQLARERVFNSTHREMTGNSTTARQLAEMGVLGAGGAGLGYAYGGAEGGVMGAVAAALARRLGGAGVNAAVGRNEEAVARALAERLIAREAGAAAIPPPPALSPAARRALMQSLSGQAGANPPVSLATP